MTCNAIIAAGGLGERLGLGIPKGLATLDPLDSESTLCGESVRRIAECGFISKVVVVLPPSTEKTFNIKKATDIEIVFCEGGTTRQQSIEAGIKTLRSLGEGDNSFVMVHDAARCLVPNSVLVDTYKSAIKFGAATACIRVADSLIREGYEPETIGDSVNRDGLWQVQTPQVFSLIDLEAAHKNAIIKNIQATDDAQLVRYLRPVARVLGHPLNFKITSKLDLELAQAIYRGEKRD